MPIESNEEKLKPNQLQKNIREIPFNCDLPEEEPHLVKKALERVEDTKKLYIGSRVVNGDTVEILFKKDYMNFITIGMNSKRVPFTFDVFGEHVLWTAFLIPGFYLDISNGFLVRRREITEGKTVNKVDYFHKWLWEWKRLLKTYKSVNHTDCNKHNNKLSNLSIEKEEVNLDDKAFETWSDKTGSDDLDAFDNFMNKDL